MVTNCIDFTSSLFGLLENWLKVLRTYFTQTWRSIHPIVNARGADKLTVGVACGQWQEAPAATIMAEIADIVEEHGKAEHVKGLAAYLQRTCALEPEVRRDLLRLADSIGRIGWIKKGYNAYALQADLELVALLKGSRRADEIVCYPDDLMQILGVMVFSGECSTVDYLWIGEELSALSGEPQSSGASGREGYHYLKGLPRVLTVFSAGTVKHKVKEIKDATSNLCGARNDGGDLDVWSPSIS